MAQTAFIAYPDGYSVVSDALTVATELSASSNITLVPWKAMKIIGFKIDDQVREYIRSSDVLIADLTYPNMNVFYEIGFAIAIGKPIITIVNNSIEKATARISQMGLFDTTGYISYNNGEELFDKIKNWSDYSWSTAFAKKTNHTQPLFILDTLAKTDFRNQIFSEVENSSVQFRSFDPQEIPRLNAIQAISETSSSAGVIVPIINQDIRDSERHNLRASFIIGLCHGYKVEVLAIQYGNGPAPMDYRDFITNSTHRHETAKHISKFAGDVLIWNQKSSSRDKRMTLGLLSNIDLGSPTAENETQKLPYYFIETAEYTRAVRAEGAVVTGRKGSGKSAIYLQMSEELYKDKRICTLDLRPSSHNLSEMREAVLSIVTAGVFDHTIASFWQFILYFEILLKIREIALPKSRNNSAMQDRIRRIEEDFSLNESVVAGDFTSRLATAVEKVIREISLSRGSDDVRQNITNIMFEKPIPLLREVVLSFSDIASEIVILIDDLDKGWPPRRVESQDISMVKHLIEALNRIRRDLGRKKCVVRHLVFLRSDIYEKLVEETSDRGKYNVIRVDWSDEAQLRHLIRERVTSSVDLGKQEDAWNAINPPLGKSDAMSVLIANSLRRPRYLIDLCERTISCATNRRHTFVTDADVDEALRQMALYLVSDFAYEMRDVAGTPEDILYSFIGESELLTEVDLQRILDSKCPDLTVPEVVDLLLWYGFLGFVNDVQEELFIYNVSYDFRRLEAERARLRGEVLYVVNPAFLKGLYRSGPLAVSPIG